MKPRSPSKLPSRPGRLSGRAAGFFCAAALLVGVPCVAHAQNTYTWNNTGTDFNTANNWTPNTGYPGVGGSTADVAVFNTAATTNPNLSASDTIATLNFSTSASSGYTLSGTNNATLTLLSNGTSASSAINGSNNSGTNTFSLPIILGAAASTIQTFTQTGGGTMAFTGGLSNTNALTDLLLTGNGTYNFSGANTGLTTQINIGSATTAPTIIINNDSGLGSGLISVQATGFTIESADTNTRTIANTLNFGTGSAPVLTFGATGSGAGSGNLVFTGAGTGTNGYISLGTGARSFVVNNATTTFNGAFGGSGGSINKMGAGTLILTGVPGSNAPGRGSSTAYGIGNTISAGTLQAGNGGANGQVFGSQTELVVNGAFLVNSSDAVAQNGSVVGTGSVSHSGTGSLTLTPATVNTSITSGMTAASYSGVTGLAVGTPVVGTGIPAGTTVAAIGTTSGSVTSITLSQAATATNTAASLTYGNAFSGGINVNGGTLSGLGGTTNASGFALGTGSITIGATGVLGSQVVDQALINRITSAPAGSVIAFGTGATGTAVVLDFSQNAALANISLGVTTGNSTTLNSAGSTLTPYGNIYRLGGGGGNLTVQGAVLTNGTGGTANPNNLVISGPVAFASSSPTYLGYTTINSGGVLTATQNSRLPATTALTINTGGTDDLVTTSDTGTTQTVASLSGSGLITNSSATSAAAPGKFVAVNLATGASSTFSGVIQDRPTSSTNTNATVGLRLIGAGTLTLSGTNTYTGGTSVTSGTLLVNGTNSGAGAVSIGGGTLGGGGSLAGAVTLTSGTITGGTAGGVGMLTLTSNAAFNGGTYQVDVSGATSDRLVFSGGSALSVAGTTLTINGTLDGATTYVIATYGSETGNFASTNVPAGYTVNYGTTEIDLVPTAVPEPSTWFGGAVLLAGLGWRVLRRRRAVA